MLRSLSLVDLFESGRCRRRLEAAACRQWISVSSVHIEDVAQPAAIGVLVLSDVNGALGVVTPLAVVVSATEEIIRSADRHALRLSMMIRVYDRSSQPVTGR